MNATDPDAGDTLTYSLTTAPTGMTINATTGLISWTPTKAQVGAQCDRPRPGRRAAAATQSFSVLVADAARATRSSAPAG